MSNQSKRKGTAAESEVIRYLQSRGRPHAERRALSGAQDRGDVAGIPGVVIEVKDTKAESWGTHLNETLTEQRNAKAAVGLLIRKRVRKTYVGDWYAVMTVDQAMDLLEQAGY